MEKLRLEALEEPVPVTDQVELRDRLDARDELKAARKLKRKRDKDQAYKRYVKQRRLMSSNDVVMNPVEIDAVLEDECLSESNEFDAADEVEKVVTQKYLHFDIQTTLLKLGPGKYFSSIHL